MLFKPHEIEFMKSADLARLATIQPDGTLQNNPVGFSYNEDLGTLDIHGYRMSKSRKFRNVVSNSTVALVIDDIAPATHGGCGAWRLEGPPNRPSPASGARSPTMTRSTPRSFGLPHVALSASASTTPRPSRTSLQPTAATCRLPPTSPRPPLDGQRRRRGGLVDCQVRQHRRADAAGMFCQPNKYPARDPR